MSRCSRRSGLARDLLTLILHARKDRGQARSHKSVASLVAFALLAVNANAATLQTYVETRTGSNQRALGYPVPLPIESQTAVAGFRSHASLFARHQALLMQSTDMEGRVVGSSSNGRPIWAYRIGDADALTNDGEPEGSLLINGTIHAREWQSPEVATAIIEDLIAGAADPGLERFLLDNLQQVVMPVFNVDGFLQTQRHPTEVLGGEDPTDPEWPRDGRMRRKNMRGVDEVLTTQADHLFGIDLNRNHAPFWATGSGSSPNPRNLIYHGAFGGSEPESQALYAAATYADDTRLRYFADLHSFSRVLFSVNTGNPAHDNFTQNLGVFLSLAESAYEPAGSNLPLYGVSGNNPNFGIGTTSEYFAHTYEIPTWTLEIEPGENGSSEYGGGLDSHDGFILPASQIARVREALSRAHRLVAYKMAGPAYLRELRIADADSGALVYAARWVKQGAQRRLAIERSLPFSPGVRYRLWLGFSKPMRLREGGVVAQIPNRPELDVELAPRIAFASAERRLNLATDAGGWLDHPGPPGFGYTRYRDDAYATVFTLPADWSGASHLELALADLAMDPLDSNPASSVDFVGGDWSGYQRSSLTPDVQHVFAVSAPSASARIVVRTRPTQLLEGDALMLELERETATTTARVRMTLESGTTALGDLNLLDPVVDFAVGETRRELRIVAAEDLVAEPGKAFSVQLAPGDAATELGDRELFVDVIDNDTAERARWRVPGPGTAANSGTIAASLRAGIAAANTATVPVAIQLPAGAPIAFDAPFAGAALPPVAARVHLDGNGGAWTLAAPGRFFEVLAGAELSLDALQLERIAQVAADDDGGLLRNRGRLELDRMQLRGGNARDGGQIYSDGVLRIARSTLIGGQAVRGAQIFARGDVALSASSLVRASAGAAAIHSEGTTTLTEFSLVEPAALPALRRAAGTFTVQGSLLAAPTVCDAASGIVSLGYNFTSDLVCAFAASGDRMGVAATYTLDAASHVRPTAVAQDVGAAECGSADLELRPRPQGSAPARCDIGAIEVGTRPRLGLWYDPARNGSGFAIETIGNLLFVVWYTFDANGDPVAYTAQNTLTGSAWDAPLLRFTRAGSQTSSSEIGRLRLNFATDDRAQASFEFGTGGTGTLALQHLVFADGIPRLPVGGAWAAPAFAFQGFSIAAQGDVLAVVSYYYDATGTLRWALGTERASDATSVTMLGFRGSCPTCAYEPPTSSLAGSVRVAFLGSDRALLDGAIDFASAPAWSTSPTELQAFR